MARKHPKRFRLTFKTLNKNAKKYWKQRYDLFSRFDYGVYMNQELWFSVTPECVAIFVAKLLRAYYPARYLWNDKSQNQHWNEEYNVYQDQNQIKGNEDPEIHHAGGNDADSHPYSEDIEKRNEEHYQLDQEIYDGEDEHGAYDETWYEDPQYKPLTVMDLFCGGGGNTIQLGKRFDRTVAVDINKDNLYCTEHNCEVYGILDNVEYIQGDWIDPEVRQQFHGKVDVIFASPPWGGPGYKHKDMFDLGQLLPMPFRELLVSLFEITPDVCLFLPRNSDLSQISEVTEELLGPNHKARIVYVKNSGFTKGILVMYGRLTGEDHYNTATDTDATAAVDGTATGVPE